MKIEYVETYDFRTGTHRYPAIEMPDGRIRAVWQAFDGPVYAGTFTSTVGGRHEPTTMQDYEEYRKRLHALGREFARISRARVEGKDDANK